LVVVQITSFARQMLVERRHLKFFHNLNKRRRRRGNESAPECHENKRGRMTHTHDVRHA
jgi:hypothetical protein